MEKFIHIIAKGCLVAIAILAAAFILLVTFILFI